MLEVQQMDGFSKQAESVELSARVGEESEPEEILAQ
jgi:hypothetical protein